MENWQKLVKIEKKDVPLCPITDECEIVKRLKGKKVIGKIVKDD